MTPPTRKQDNSTVEAIQARPSLAELESQAKEEAVAQAAEAEAVVSGLLKEAKAEHVESIQKLKNGELERALNVILHHEVKRSHVNAIRRALEAYWYRGLDRSPDVMKEMELSKFLVWEIVQERFATRRENQTAPAGALLMATVREFIEKFQRDHAAKSPQEALGVLERITSLAGPGLSDVELRALAAVIAYPKAESMKAGNSKPGTHPSTVGGV